jgi:3-oxoacyl-[acyl-carrier protein] reductase
MVDLLKGKVAIITGSGRGIGASMAEIFVEEGAKVTISDVDKAPCDETTGKINAAHAGCAIGVVCDVTKEDQVNNLVKETVKAFGKVDILVNCAGFTRDALVHKMEDKLLNQIIDINLKGTILCTKAILPEFLREGRNNEFKKVINFASSTGVTGNLGQANYAIAKGGVIGFTKAAAREYALDRINVNVVAPGFIETRMTAVKKPGDILGMPQAIRDIAIGAIPFARDGKGGQPYHVADVVMFFASKLSDWITGQLLTIDGGSII